MESDQELAEQLHQFNAELAGTDWRASLTRSGLGWVCLRVERPSPTRKIIEPQALELCRRSFAEAANSARKYIFTKS
jgi:hypothetical protein